EFTQIVEVPGIVGRLQADEVQLGLAREAFGIETGSDRLVEPAGRCGGCGATEGLAGLERALGCLRATGRSPGVLQTAARLAGRIRAPTEKQAEDEESGGREQQDHEEVREAFAEAEVREQRRQTKTCGETGDRTHPRTLGLCGS